MRGYAARDVHADRCNLSWVGRNGVWSRGRPYARKPGHAFRRYPEIRAGPNQDFFHPAYVLDRTGCFALTILRHKTTQIENWIANQLSRPMEGHVTTPVALEDFHTPLSQFRRGSKDIRRLRVAAQCNDRRVLEQKEDVTDAIFL